MDEKPDQILNHIEAQRDELGRNLNELESRVKQSTDWRTYFDRNPMMMLGVALGGGLLLGSLAGGSATHRVQRKRSGRSYSSSSSSRYAGLGASSAGVGASSAGIADLSSGSGSYTPPSSRSTSKSGLLSSENAHRLSETMEDVKAALVAFGIAKAKEFLSEAIPGFDQHLNDAQDHRRQRSGGVHEHSHEHRYEHSHPHSHEHGPSHEHEHSGAGSVPSSGGGSSHTGGFETTGASGSFTRPGENYGATGTTGQSSTQSSGFRGSHEANKDREPVIVTP